MSNSKIPNPPQKNFSCPELYTAVLQCRFIKGKKTDYYCERVLKLSNLNYDFVLKKKQFCQLSLRKSGFFGFSHHAIVASDGINKDKIIDYTSPLGSKIANLIPSWFVNCFAEPIGILAAAFIVGYMTEDTTSMQRSLLSSAVPTVEDGIEESIAEFIEWSIIDLVESRKSAELKFEDFKGDMSQLVRIGTVETTYDQLKDTATKSFNDNPRCTFYFDSQTFCQRFIQVSLPHTHKADAEKANKEAVHKVTYNINSYEESQLRALIWPKNSIVRAFM